MEGNRKEEEERLDDSFYLFEQKNGDENVINHRGFGGISVADLPL